MNFIKNIMLVLMFIFSMNCTQSNAADVNEPATVAQDSQVTENAAIELLELFGQIKASKQESMSDNLGISCFHAKIICGSIDCCKWGKKYTKDSCSYICDKVQGYCANCPSGYKILCDAGCPYKDQCGDLCPCIKSHCN